MPVQTVRNWVIEMVCEDKSVLRRVFDNYEEAMLFLGFLRKKGRHPEIWQL